MPVRQTKTGRGCARGRLRIARAMACLLLISAGATGASPAASMPQAKPTAIDLRDPYGGAIDEAATRFGIPAAWIRAVIRIESGDDPRAVSPVGAMGLMQVMPSTWAALTARHALGGDPFDIRANILAGTAYLRELIDRYADLPTALAAYNAGPGRVDAWRARRRPLPTETIAYVARITPLIGTPGDAPIAPPSIPAAPSWRAAGLFAQRNSDANPTSTNAPASHDIATPASPSVVATPVHRDGLFVPLSGS